MSTKSIRNAAAAWARRARAAVENFIHSLQAESPRASTRQGDALAGLRCVWYGRAMFCLYLPTTYPPRTNAGAASGVVEDTHRSDPYASPRLEQPVAAELEEFHRAAGTPGRAT